MNLLRPPFRVIPGQSAEDAANEIVAAFVTIETLPRKVSSIYHTLSYCLNLEYPKPLIAAGYSLAKAIDDNACYHDQPYHNSQHCCEVMLSAYFLSRLVDINRQETAEIVFAALIHDFQHDGKPNNGDIQFRLERSSVNKAEPYLLAAGITKIQQQKLAALILATNTAIGLPVARSCYDHHTRGTSLPKIPSSAPELVELCDNPAASLQAIILCEADILPSIGLTTEYALKLQEKLSVEWGARLELEDKLRFIDNQRHSFIASNFFYPNIDKIRQAILNRLHQ